MSHTLGEELVLFRASRDSADDPDQSSSSVLLLVSGRRSVYGIYTQTHTHRWLVVCDDLCLCEISEKEVCS